MKIKVKHEGKIGRFFSENLRGKKNGKKRRKKNRKTGFFPSLQNTTRQIFSRGASKSGGRHPIDDFAETTKQSGNTVRPSAEAPWLCLLLEGVLKKKNFDRIC